MDRFTHREDDGKYASVPKTGDRVPEGTPLSGKTESDPFDGKPFDEHDVGPGWTPVGEE